jgi:hypothetical protein
MVSCECGYKYLYFTVPHIYELEGIEESTPTGWVGQWVVCSRKDTVFRFLCSRKDTVFRFLCSRKDTVFRRIRIGCVQPSVRYIKFIL